ncbi:MAG: phage integrase SAM-like domain-containing protein [Patescibacteria group bacterium]
MAKYPRPDPLQHPGQLLLLQQAQQIQNLTEQCKTLAAMLAAGGSRGGGPGTGQAKKIDPRKAALRATPLADYCTSKYLPGRGHSPTSETADLALRAIAVLSEYCAPLSASPPTLADVRPSLLDGFREWLVEQVAAGRWRAQTANKFLRHLRSVYNYAARKRLIRPMPPLELLPEEDPIVEAWSPEDLAKQEDQARRLDGCVRCGEWTIPRSTWWTAWTLVFSRTGGRKNVVMLSERSDYDRNDKAILLRKENQKQKKDQRIALPPRAAAAVEKLLDSHGDVKIFPWPFDPPSRKNGKRKWKVLDSHFERLLLTPCGLKLPKNVKTRQYRRTAATLVDDAGGNPQELLGHRHASTTERYKDRRRKKICRQSLCIPDPSPQLTLF